MRIRPTGEWSLPVASGRKNVKIDMNMKQNYEEQRRMNKKYAHTTFNEQKVCIHKKKMPHLMKKEQRLCNSLQHQGYSADSMNMKPCQHSSEKLIRCHSLPMFKSFGTLDQSADNQIW